MASTSPLISPVDVVREPVGLVDPTGLRSELENGGVKRPSLLPGGGNFTRSGRRSTVASNLRVKPAKQIAGFTERQERLYAKIRYQAEAKIDEALEEQRSSAAAAVPSARERRRAERAAFVGAGGARAREKPAGMPHPPNRDGFLSARVPKPAKRTPVSRPGLAEPRNPVTARPNLERSMLRSRARQKVAAGGARAGAGGSEPPGRKGNEALSAAELAADPIRMRKHLETLASQMRKQHVRAANEQRHWEERRQGQQEKLTGLMEEARRAVGRNLQADMVALERAKLKQARQAPRKMKRHVNAWAGFEADVDDGTIAEIGLSDIPFPPKDNVLLLANRGQDATGAERKRAFRAASLRWHPDKFVQRFGARLHDTERDDILDKVTATFQLVNEAYHGR
jgi:NF-kappa-B inhibitor-like protein 1